MVFPGAAAQVGNIDTKLDVVMLMAPTHDVIDLEIVFGVQQIRLRSSAGERSIYYNPLTGKNAARGVVVLLEEELELVEQCRRDHYSVVKDDVVFTSLRIDAALRQHNSADAEIAVHSVRDVVLQRYSVRWRYVV